jgi:hypothetical protein
MTQEPRHKVHGTPMSEWIRLVPGELPQDAVGLWQILAAAEHGFGLGGAEQVDYVRRNIYALIDYGAVPVKGGKGTEFDWIAKQNYGASRDQIAEAIIAEWQASKHDEFYPFEIWFALPRGNVGNLRS